MNYFEVFDLPQILNLDSAQLEKTFHRLSRQYHPDYFTTAPPEERSRALRMTALLNDAYRTLRHPTRRVEYLLSVNGLKPDGSKVPQSLLMEVFEINEQLHEVKVGSASAEQQKTLRQLIKTKRDDFESRLGHATREWDQLISSGAGEPERRQQLLKLGELLSEVAYISNIENELEDRPRHS